MKNLVGILASLLALVSTQAQNEFYVNGDNDDATIEVFINNMGSEETFHINGEFYNDEGTVTNDKSVVSLTGDFTNFSGSGGSYSSSGTLLLKGVVNQSVTGDKIDAHLVVLENASGANVLSSCVLNVDSALRTTTGIFTAEIGSDVVLISNIGGDAYLNDFEGSGSYIGALNVQRYVNNGTGNDQHFIASPISSASVTELIDDLIGPWGTGLPGSNGVALTPSANCSPDSIATGSNYGNLFEWNESLVLNDCAQGGWTVRSSGTLENGRGYSAYIPVSSTADFVGTPNTGAKSFTGTTTGTSSNTDVSRWVLAGNPYPSPMVWTAPTGFDAIAKVYNVSGPYSGTFTDLVGGASIAIGQGISVRTSSVGAFDFSVSNSDRTTSAAVWRSQGLFDYKIDIEVVGNTYADKTTIFFSDQCSDYFDPTNEDGIKRILKTNQPHVYSSINGNHLSTNGIPSSSYGAYPIALGMNPGSNGVYTFNFEGLSTLPYGSFLFLEDKLTDNWINLNENNVYTYDMSITDDPNRFELHFSPPIDFNLLGASCAGSDGKIVIDVGEFEIADNTMQWSYELSQNQEIIVQGMQSGLLEFSNLQSGIYDLLLSAEGFEFIDELNITGPNLVNAEFETNTSTVLLNDFVEIENLSEGATSYLWTVNNEEYIDEDLHYVFTSAGDYVIGLEASNEDCNSIFTHVLKVIDDATGIDNSFLNDLLVYQEEGVLIIDNSNALLEIETLGIYNVSGQVVISKTNLSLVERIDLSQLASGIYWLKVITENGANSIGIVNAK